MKNFNKNIYFKTVHLKKRLILNESYTNLTNREKSVSLIPHSKIN